MRGVVWWWLWWWLWWWWRPLHRGKIENGLEENRARRRDGNSAIKIRTRRLHLSSLFSSKITNGPLYRGVSERSRTLEYGDEISGSLNDAIKIRTRRLHLSIFFLFERQRKHPYIRVSRASRHTRVRLHDFGES